MTVPAFPAHTATRFLVLLGSGATQHVFQRSPDDAWVFKIPALRDDLLPSDPVTAATRDWPAPRRLAVSHGPGRVAAAAWLRWRRVTSFRRMLGLLNAAHAAGVGDVLAPFHVLAGSARHFQTPAGRIRYRGPVLVQARMDPFLEDARDIALCPWRELAAAQQRLWQAGFGLADAASAFGPDGWGLFDGRLVLADTGSLTASAAAAADVADPARLARFRARQLRRCNDPDRVRAYFDFMAWHVNPVRIRAAWPAGRAAQTADLTRR